MLYKRKDAREFVNLNITGIEQKDYYCQLFQHEGVQQERSCFFGHCTQMNLMLGSISAVSRVRSLILREERRLDA